ncbi:hypothetical protein COLO4_20565 [Corchorus olitorius]|uniref:Uncharacterized protein n=1 Tax=Corchorus olitorius TaxID=93759 RepID=A0A1R3IYZ9_9ROSI|nr:hypothetical protein COLO4_20565 [Corchorus olitorius]
MGGNAAAGEESEHPNSVLISISSDREEASVHGAVVVVMGNFKRLVIERDRDFTPEHEPSLPLSPHQSHDPESHSKRLTVVRVFCKADTNLVLTIRDSQVILAQVDPSNEYQQWYKEEKFSTRVKDEYGFPSFALVNKATGQALKHSIGATHPVQLIAYKADEVDTSILWSQGCLKDMLVIYIWGACCHFLELSNARLTINIC